MKSWASISIGIVLLAAAGCTLAEWQRVGEDAVAQAPEAVTDIVSNPTPLGIAIVVGTYIAGLISKSAARGFGRAGSATISGVASVVSKVLKK